MHLPQKFKQLTQYLVIGQILFCFNLWGDSKKVAVFPIAGNGMTQTETENIADLAVDSICDELSKYGYQCVDRSQGLRSILKEKGLSQSGVLTEGNYQEIGKLSQAEFVMPITVSKFSDNSGYGIRANVVNAVDGKSVPGMNVSRAYSAFNQRDLAEQVKGLGGEIGKRLDQSESYVQSSKSCTNITVNDFANYFAACAQSSSSNANKFVECYSEKAVTFCSNNNSTNSTCVDSCSKTAGDLFLTFINEYDRQSTECEKKGKNYTFTLDGECKYTGTPKPDPKPDPDPTVKNPPPIPPPDHSGWASWIVPGLGLGLKNRPGSGLFFFAVTLGAFADYSNKREKYNQAKEDYHSIFPIPYPVNLGFAGQYL